MITNPIQPELLPSLHGTILVAEILISNVDEEKDVVTGNVTYNYHSLSTKVVALDLADAYSLQEAAVVTPDNPEDEDPRVLAKIQPHNSCIIVFNAPNGANFHSTILSPFHEVLPLFIAARNMLNIGEPCIDYFEEKSNEAVNGKCSSACPDGCTACKKCDNSGNCGVGCNCSPQ